MLILLIVSSLTSVALGLAFGIVSVLWLGFIFNDTIIEIALTLAVSYIAFFTVRPCHFRSPYFPSIFSEALLLLMLIYYQAQDSLEISGVLTVMTLGMLVDLC